MPALEELDAVFSIFHDGSIASWSGDKRRLTLKINCLYLAERIDQSYDCFYVDLVNVDRIEFKAWMNLPDDSCESKTELDDVFSGDLEIMSAEIVSGVVCVTCLQHDPSLDYSGGVLSIGCESIRLYDHGKNEITIAALTVICRDYWENLERKGELFRTTMKKIHHTHLQHLALIQYYRWYQVYELPFTPGRIANQLDILADEVEIISAQGTTKGKAGLPDRLKVYEGWKNAHHVKQVEVKEGENNTLLLEADILYQNIRPDDSRFSYTIHYSTVLQLQENDLPVFSQVKLAPTGVIDPPAFEAAYAENRARSFMHYWLYLVEMPETSAPKFRELLAPDFILELSTTGTLTTLEQVDAWLASIPPRIKAAAHFPKNVSVKEQADGSISVSVDFDWEGISAAGEPMIAETHHEWTLVNDPDERFARMKHMRVVQLKPFQIVEVKA